MAHRLRVIAGTVGGLHLVAPKGARPTTDRAKEALFASLGQVVDEANVLDLFAGSGALGIEALSRGAAHATFVDDDADAIAAIRRNLATTGFAERADVRRQAVGGVLRRSVDPDRAAASDDRAGYDLVFLDPPYGLGGEAVARLLVDLGAGPWLAAGATVVVERRKGDPVDLPSHWEVAAPRTYGDTLLLVATA